jgi:hypothetical protein
MSLKHCPGRLHYPLESLNEKWYTIKTKSCYYYTCCQECYEKYIKGTNKEILFEETKGLSGCNCDYLIYDTDCNFSDCSSTKNDVRISIIDNLGKRFKKTLSNDNYNLICEIPKNSEYSLFIENLFKDENENSFISVEYLFVNDKKCEIIGISNLEKYTFEFLVSLEGIFPELSNENILSMDNIEIRLKINKYKLLLNRSPKMLELDQDPNGFFVDLNGHKVIKAPNDAENNYKAFVGLNLYHNEIKNQTEFTIQIKHNDKKIHNTSENIKISI